MVGDTGYCRFAIAALGVPHPVRNAIDDLCSNQFSAQELCIAGLPGPIDALSSTIAGTPSARDANLMHLLDVEPLDLVGGSVPIVATTGRLLTTLKKEKAGTVGAGGNGHGKCWLPTKMRASLLDYMTNGDVMLMAGPVSQRQWVLGTQVLLRHSRHPVQGNELASRRAT